MVSDWLLPAVALLGVLLADRFAHHDELAARRFRELDPRVVGNAVDRSRNRRWHRAGFWLRLLAVALVAGLVAGTTGSWVAGGLALLVAGSLVSLLFDIFFNIRFGMAWDYVGSTAWLDEWLTKLGIERKLNMGRVAAGIEASGVLVGVVAWLLIF